MIGNGAHEYTVHTEKLCGEITVYSTHARELCIIRKNVQRCRDGSAKNHIETRCR